MMGGTERGRLGGKVVGRGAEQTWRKRYGGRENVRGRRYKGGNIEGR